MPLPDDVINALQALLWAPAEQREALQALGITVVPANFYSSVPSLAEIRAAFDYREAQPYALPGLFDAGHMTAVLAALQPAADEFRPPVDGDAEAPAGYFWNNTQFSHADALAYYAFLRTRRPQTVVEVGAGFSSLVADAALRANDRGRLICIEPYPRPFLHGLASLDTLLQQPVQTLDAEWFNSVLADGDVLFIDSTHTVKVGSDCLHLYLRLLPRLQHELLIHVHDVFLPAAMPQDWALDKHIYWTEQYLLLAYLLDNPLVKVEFGSHYHRLNNPEALTTFMAGKAAARGGSLWFRRAPSHRTAR